MAKLSKQWGTIIGCWCVALVMVVTGVCLALTIPSSAAGEVNIAVTFDGETNIYHTMEAANEAVNACETTADKPVTIQLQSDIFSGSYGGLEFENKNYVLDLNGHYLSYSSFYIDNTNCSFQIIDSNPTALHYCSYNTVSGVYEFTNYEKLGEANTPVYGGVMAGHSFSIIAHDGGEITLDGGTFVGKVGSLQAAHGVEAVVKNCTWQVLSPNPYGESFENVYGVFVIDSTLTINGGTIYGEIGWVIEEAKNIEIVDLADPQTDAVKVNVNMESTEINGVKIYQAVKNDEPETPTTKPTKPIADAKNEPANNDNVVGLIVLGAAAAVVVVGVTTVILVMNKRRKKVA